MLDNKTKWWQFGIRGLLLATTCIALVLAAYCVNGNAAIVLAFVMTAMYLATLLEGVS